MRTERPKLLLGALVLLLASWPAGRATAQLFIRSAEKDVEQGAEVAQMVEQQIGLYSQPGTEGYVAAVGSRLASAADDPRWNFGFHIVDQAEPNAFAVPGGGIYISRGLLALVNREDELAGVLGHEIAHVTERHSARQQRKGFLPGLLSLPGNLVSTVVSEDLGELINTPLDAVGGAWMSHYSRGQESDSDRLGIRTAAKAGYDPAALADMLLRLQQDIGTRTGQEQKFSFFASHPMTESRLKKIRSQAAKLQPVPKPGIAPDKASLYSQLDGLWWGENPQAGVFRKEQFLQPTIGFTIHLPQGWKHQNTPRYLVSVDPKQEAMLLLAVAKKAAEPQTMGDAFIQQMRKKAGIEPVSSRKASVGEFPAFVTTYLDRSGRTPTYLHYAWVTMNGTTYQMTGLAPERHRESLKNAALSLRPLTDTERGSVTGKRLRVVAAREGERLENLGARCGNIWTPAYTALVNGLNTEMTLEPGYLVKIAREERWNALRGEGH
jgi:predicted Zn-dependent protease